MLHIPGVSHNKCPVECSHRLTHPYMTVSGEWGWGSLSSNNRSIWTFLHCCLDSQCQMLSKIGFSINLPFQVGLWSAGLSQLLPPEPETSSSGRWWRYIYGGIWDLACLQMLVALFTSWCDKYPSVWLMKWNLHSPYKTMFSIQCSLMFNGIINITWCMWSVFELIIGLQNTALLWSSGNSVVKHRYVASAQSH